MVATRPVSIVGQDAAVVQELTSRYFHIKRLNWKTNTEAVYKKGVSILHFLRELRYFWRISVSFLWRAEWSW